MTEISLMLILTHIYTFNKHQSDSQQNIVFLIEQETY